VKLDETPTLRRKTLENWPLMYIQYAIAIIPVAIYLVLIGVTRLRPKPLVTTGWRDTLTLGIASAGLVAVGPMQLFTPPQALEIWRAWVWIMLVGLYVLGLTLVLLSGKPRLIAYGLDSGQFREILTQAAQRVDSQAQWSANVLSLPLSGIQLAMEATGSPRVHQVSHVGLLHNLEHWMILEREFVRLGGQADCPRSWAGWPLLLLGAVLLLSSIIPLLQHPGEALVQLQHFLER
jgi:hypothetical protein